MPSSREYLSYIMEQLAPLEGITTRQMMGEYIIYYQGKIAAELCDDRLLVKPVPAALALLPDAPQEMPAVPSASAEKQAPLPVVGEAGMGLSCENCWWPWSRSCPPQSQKNRWRKRSDRVWHDGSFCCGV